MRSEAIAAAKSAANAFLAFLEKLEGDDEDSNLVKHARRELELAEYFDGDVNEMMANDVLELITVFSKQGHSGGSAPFCLRLFNQLASFKPLGPLTGKDDEWNEVSDGLWQNRRCSSVFKDGEHAYRIDGKVFRDPNGSCWTNSDSRVDVAFPYTVCEPEIIDKEDA